MFASMSPSLPSSSARRLLPSKSAPIFPASPFIFFGSRPSGRNCGNLSASGETDDDTRSLLRGSGAFAVVRFRRGGEGDAGDCVRCGPSLVGELVPKTGRRNAAGSPKIAADVTGGLQAEDEGKLGANNRVFCNGCMSMDTDFPWNLPLSTDEIERT